MQDFFSDTLLLSTKAAQTIYQEIAALPIIDFHSHLDALAIAEDRHFASLGELWLAEDHYKWRAMRLCGVPEEFITGDKTSFDEKFFAFASIFPSLIGNPLTYFCQMELLALFGIRKPLNAENAPAILAEANEKLAGLSVRALLKKFRVEKVATTNDPTENLAFCGHFDGTTVMPTFRPDRFLSLDPDAIAALSRLVGAPLDTLAALKAALASRLDFFAAHGCVLADHGSDRLPAPFVPEEEAARLYARRASLSPEEKHRVFSHLYAWLCGEYRRRGILLQMHFGTYRNVNTAAFAAIGRDAGFDIMRSCLDTDPLAPFLDSLLQQDALPAVILYPLNPNALPALAVAAGAFPNIYLGAAWWFNDSVSGIKQQLAATAEYAALGRAPGMLTDGRSFSGYVRFDFYRRILADYLGGLVERGEADKGAACRVARALSYDNAKALFG